MKTPTLDQLTRDELSLLLFLETCAVDRTGKIEDRRMNDDDREIAKRWHKEGFINYGRICAANLTPEGSHWCHLSDEAWRLAGEARKARADRTWSKRTWQTTDEKRGVAATQP